MALEEYKRKRDFKKTAEPPPGKVKAGSKGQLSYLIQKHDATRLHYDFRLELDGVLLSWAVTKGPSLNPADKRLAVRTEDHPLSYGSFEGTIPKGEYGGGSVMLWDTGTWEPVGDPQAGLQKGHLAFVLHGNRLRGRWDLVRMRTAEKRENWLLIKVKDEESSSASNIEFLESFASSVKTGRSMEAIARGEAVKPQAKKSSKGIRALTEAYDQVQLATLVDSTPTGDDWLHEIKLDGYRLLGFASGDKVALRTRNGNDWTESFPAIRDAMGELETAGVVLDMEAVILDKEGKSSFQSLQAALGEGGDPRKAIGYVFDLLYLDGKDFTKAPLLERKKALETLLKNAGTNVLRYSSHVAGQGAQMFKEACERGLEGIISKKADSLYVAGRQKTWLKIKCRRRQEFVILGYSSSRAGDRSLGALYVGYRKEGKLIYSGKVGTGFSNRSSQALTGRFSSIARDEPVLTRAETSGMPAGEWRKIHWVEPALLCEVAFTEWTDDGRIRHPSFQGLREDKSAQEVTQEVPAPTSVVANKNKNMALKGINITHPERVISETGHVTKGDLAQYYAGVAEHILPQLIRRPLSLLRCPAGLSGACFFQRNPGRGLGADVKPFEFNHKGKTYQYLYIEDSRGLLEVIQMGAIELHPWGATVDQIDCPDRMIFDLDPAEDVPFEALKLAAQDLRKRLQDKGLESTLKCTGGKGLHVTVPLAVKDDWESVKAFAGALANEMVVATPVAYVATMSKAKRMGKIFIDYFRNDYTATAIADYSVRARPGAPVAVPLDWSELKGLTSPSQFTLHDVLKRVKRKSPKQVAPQVLP